MMGDCLFRYFSKTIAAGRDVGGEGGARMPSVFVEFIISNSEISSIINGSPLFIEELLFDPPALSPSLWCGDELSLTVYMERRLKNKRRN
jgi:hypothetical protein